MNDLLVILLVFCWVAIILYLSKSQNWTKAPTWVALIAGAILIGAFL